MTKVFKNIAEWFNATITLEKKNIAYVEGDVTLWSVLFDKHGDSTAIPTLIEKEYYHKGNNS